MIAATCASVASWMTRDRPIGGFALVAIDDLAHARFLEPGDRGQHADRAIEIRRMEPDNRDAVGGPVLDDTLPLRS